jgi:ribonuclease J
MHGSVGSVMLIESGDVLEIDELGARKAGRINVGRVCIDSGSRTDVVEDIVIKDRRHLSEDGFVMPIIAINKLSGLVETAPEIVTRGFSPGENGEKIRTDLKRYISRQTQRRPLIMPVILEI